MWELSFQINDFNIICVCIYKKTKAFLKMYTFVKVELKDLITCLLCWAHGRHLTD